MVNILIVTHGDFGKELKNSAKLIVGDVSNIESISYDIGDNFKSLVAEVEKKIKRMSNDSELMVFTDMYGGSPFNAVTRFMNKYDFDHVTGVNFPLFLDIALNRNAMNLDEIEKNIINDGKKSIVFVNENLGIS